MEPKTPSTVPPAGFRLPNPLRWSTVDRGIAVVGLTLAFRLINLSAALQADNVPGFNLFTDREQMTLYVRLLIGSLVGWIVLLGLGLALRQRKKSEPYVLIVLGFFWLTHVTYGTSIGLMTNTFWVTFLGAAMMMLLLFGPRLTYSGMAPGMVLLGASVFAERMGIIRYAPIYLRQPFDERGHPLAAWFALNGGLSLAISILLLTLAHLIFTQWKQYDARLEQLSATDHLTSLSNRRSFRERATAELSRGRRASVPMSVVMLDVDFFKQVNDTHGHAAGDAVLIAVAELMRNVVREHDLIARYGGEEFVILLVDADMTGATVVAERLRTQVESTLIDFGNTQVGVTVTLGVATSPGGASVALDELIREADEALYKGKESGRNKVVPATSPPVPGDLTPQPPLHRKKTR